MSYRKDKIQAREGIQALRAIAFLLVLLQHVIYFSTLAKGLDFRPYLMVDFGTIGVFMFFMISGYVMGECFHQGPRFILNRAVRIYPPFWFAIGLSWLMLSRYQPWHFDWWSALLLPSKVLNNSYMIPFWTLCYEMAFYVVVYIFILARMGRQAVACACAAWLGIVILVTLYKVNTPIMVAQPGWWIAVAPPSIFFITGLAISISGIGQLKASSMQLFIPGLLLWTAGRGGGELHSIALTSLGLACILLAAQRMHFSQILVRMGDFSYGAYLMHMMLMMLVLSIFKNELASMWLGSVFIILFFISGVGSLAYGWLEFHLHSRLRRYIC